MKILGTTLEDIDRAENRNKFEAALQELKIPQPQGETAVSKEEAIEIGKKLASQYLFVLRMYLVDVRWKSFIT